jgi:hypothetical protein
VESTSLRKTLLVRLLISGSHHCAIQDKDQDFYLQFQIVICGLDSVEARRWINATLVNMVDWSDPERTLKPLIDGGTEGKHLKLQTYPLIQPKVFEDRLVLSFQLRVLATNALWICLANVPSIQYAPSQRHHDSLSIASSGLRS